MISNSISSFYDCLSNVIDPLFKTRIKDVSGAVNQTLSNEGRLPWYDDPCKEKQRQFYRFLNKYSKDKTDLNRTNMVKARSKDKGLLRKKNFLFDMLETKKVEQLRCENAKAYWSLLKTSCGRSSSNSNKLNSDIFAEYFKAVNNPMSQFYQPDEDVVYFNDKYVNGELQEMFEELNLKISRTEVFKACKELHCGKAGGPDLVINEFFKYGVDFMIDYLHKLFNVILDTGYFPEQWTEGYIIPLHKKGDKDRVENYRPITLLSTMGKLFTRILNNRLCDWAEKYHVYVEAQAGFRQKMGTIDNVFVVNGLINHMLNENKRLFAAFVDFSKAFDYVVKDNLWFKSIQSGVRGEILNVVKSMYKSVKSRVL